MAAHASSYAPRRRNVEPTLSHRRARKAALEHPDARRAMFIAQILEYLSARDGGPAAVRFSPQVVAAWGRYLASRRDALPAAEHELLRGWARDYLSGCETPEEFAEAAQALLWLDEAA